MIKHLQYFGFMTVVWALALLFIQPPVVKVFHTDTDTYVLSFPLLLLYATFLGALTTVVHLLFVAK